ncbi:flavodoxin domain-containing protein [Candidatus Bipolaricaulota sp. J31]
MTRVLVTYATRCGSTREVAEGIGKALAGAGLVADVRPVGEVNDLSPYRAAVVGSPIRGGKWLSEAVGFVRGNREALSQIPVAYFAVGLSLREGTEEARREAMAALESVRELVAPVDVGLFAGALDPRKLPWILRLLMRLIKVPAGDFRDWTAIRAWATRLGKSWRGQREPETS